MTGEPYSKERQLARGTRRYRRKVASPKQWQAIIAAKRGPCRVCGAPTDDEGAWGNVNYHHIVPRDMHGDDVADNIVPLHAGGDGFTDCHDKVTRGVRWSLAALAASLTDSERAYVVGKLGEDGLVRLFGATLPASTTRW